MKILFHAREAGVATQLNVLKEWLAEFDCQIYYDLNEMAETCLGKQEVTSIEGMDCLICGYDSSDRFEVDEILNKADQLGVKSIAVLDAWKGLTRFWRSGNNLRKLATYTIVPDNTVYQYLLDHGFHGSELSVASLPALTTISEEIALNFNDERIKARNKLNLNLESKVVLFLSEPLIDSDGMMKSAQNMKLRARAGNIYQYIADHYAGDATLLARQHPVETVYHSKSFVCASQLTYSEAICVADLILGMGTTLMLYASYLGVKCKSLIDLFDGGSPNMMGYEPIIWKKLQEQFFENNTNERMQVDGSASRKHYLSLVGCHV